MATIAIVDYGMCNLHSVWQAVLAAVGAENTAHQVLITSSPDAVRAAERIVLPGQGAMPDCMRELRDSGLQVAVLEAAQTKPLFGVCVGMQMLLDASEEGNTPGLGLIAGQVKKFKLSGQLQPDGSAYKVPQMGWNRVKQAASEGKNHVLWANVPDDTRFYFVHSFAAYTTHPAEAVGLTVYGDERAPFASAIARDNIFATQFHPEKSAAHGIQLYRNFLRWNP